MASVEERERQLKDRLDELQARLRSIDQQVEQQTGTEVADQASEPEDEDVLESLGEASLKEIRMIESALDRIRQGEYGTCARCGDPISEERLDAVPATPLCRDCAAG